MRYRIKAGIRAKRIRETEKLYTSLTDVTTSYEERLFKALKVFMKDKTAAAVEDKIYKFMRTCLDGIAQEAIVLLKQMFPGDQDNIPHKLDSLLYSKDGKVLKDRLDKWCTEDINYEMLFVYLCRIMETEKASIIVNLIRGWKSVKYMEIVGYGDCANEGGPCGEYLGNVYKIEEMTEDMYPPYHPLCECIACAYGEDEVDIV